MQKLVNTRYNGIIKLEDVIVSRTHSLSRSHYNMAKLHNNVSIKIVVSELKFSSLNNIIESGKYFRGYRIGFSHRKYRPTKMVYLQLFCKKQKLRHGCCNSFVRKKNRERGALENILLFEFCYCKF